MKKVLIVLFLSTFSLAQSAAPEKPKPTPVTDPAERKALLQAIDTVNTIGVKLQQQQAAHALALAHFEAALRLAQLQIQKAQVDAQASTVKLESQLQAANIEYLAIENEVKRKHNAEGCERVSGTEWKCPDPPKPAPMCGDKPCAEKIEAQKGK